MASTDGTAVHASDHRFVLRGSYGAGGASRPWLSSLFASSGLYLLVIGVLVLFSATSVIVKKVPVAITFVEKIIKPSPPPPPPPPVVEAPKPTPPPAVQPKAAAALAPVVRPDQKIRKLDKPPPPKELVAPKEMPKQAAPEADPSQDKGVAVYGDPIPGKGDPAGLEGGVAKGGRLGGIAGGAVDLPAGAQPPVRSGGPLPLYPRQAKVAELEGTVVLKIIVLVDGSVSKVEVVSGTEPFIAAAVRAVKEWRYRPARQDGQPIAVFHTVRIPFTLADEDEG